MTPYEQSASRFIELVTIRREEMGLNSGKVLGRAMGTSEKALERALRDRILPNVKSLCAAARTLNIDLAYVLEPMLTNHTE